MKKIIFIIYITLLIQAEDNIFSIYKVEGYNSLSPNQESTKPIQGTMEQNNSSLILANTSQKDSYYKFQTDYDNVLNQAKRENRYIFLLVTEEFCQWCEKLIDIVFQDKRIVNRLKSDYIGVMVDRNKDFYPSNIGVTGVPSVFIINQNTGKIIMNIVGYHDVDFYLEKFKEMDSVKH